MVVPYEGVLEPNCTLPQAPLEQWISVNAGDGIAAYLPDKAASPLRRTTAHDYMPSGGAKGVSGDGDSGGADAMPRTRSVPGDPAAAATAVAAAAAAAAEWSRAAAGRAQAARAWASEGRGTLSSRKTKAVKEVGH